MTDEERRLWWYLRDGFDEIKWRRPEPIGPFIADFVTHSHQLVVEADGATAPSAIGMRIGIDT